jgi:hypothetical protein
MSLLDRTVECRETFGQLLLDSLKIVRSSIPLYNNQNFIAMMFSKDRGRLRRPAAPLLPPRQLLMPFNARNACKHSLSGIS